MGSTLSTCTGSRKTGAITLSEKGSTSTPPSSSSKLAGDRIITILQTSRTPNEARIRVQELQKDTLATTVNWEGLATYLLDSVKPILEAGVDLSEAMRATYDDVKAEYATWKAENPTLAAVVEATLEVLFTTLAIALLAEFLGPWFLEALGFEMLGPRLGSWAARWQATWLNPGEVPAGSLFSFLQRMGMKYGIKH